MKVTTIGAGYVGLVTAACLAEIGNDVVCLDIDPAKIDLLNEGGVPIHEPGLKELIHSNRATGRLRFTMDVNAAIAHGDIVFISVGTPSDKEGHADLQYVLTAARDIGEHMNGFKVVVNKSTVPIGTSEKIYAAIDAALQARKFEENNSEGETISQPTFVVVSNPEFLKCGAAVDDFMRPDRIVIGISTDALGKRALTILRHLYEPFNRNHERILCMDARSAEFTKYAANAMLATRISLMNELANLADKVGVDIECVRKGIGTDSRIGLSFLYAGTGYGGSCLPKDVGALIQIGNEQGQPLKVLQAVEEVNNAQKLILLDKIIARFGTDLTQMTFAVWGLAFKPDTDDMRTAPSRTLIRELSLRGACIKAHDPVAMIEARRVLAIDHEDIQIQKWQHHVTFVDQPFDALLGADALIIVTQWKAYQRPDFAVVKQLLRHPVIFDGRNIYEPEVVAAAELQYFGVGRQG